ncbi:MAG: pantoate--beta-alanine ligase [Alphaproteobacteria bacterium]|nr:MAG: pantoate--beta-alanine ligase [Alphaproteobacteria bacterium]
MVMQIGTVAALRKVVGQWRKAGERIALVPTMGALHAGHRALVRLGRQRADRVIVSIFVNPMQFGPDEDFSRYPRTLQSDLDALNEEEADAAFLPAVSEMYGEGFATEVMVRGLSESLEGEHRPGHFTGVATVVTKLLIQSLPDFAVFGEKDYQQLVIVRRLVADLDLPVRILPCPIVREEDGLALSSRNVYLSPAARRIAPRLHATLRRLKEAAEAGTAPLHRLEEEGRRSLLQAGFEAVDYLTFRDAETLAPVTDLQRPVRLLATARLEGVRLLDNLAVGPRPSSA